MKKLVSVLCAIAFIFSAIPITQASDNQRSNSTLQESTFAGISLNAFEIEPKITEKKSEDGKWNVHITSKVTPRVITVRPITFVRDLYELSEDKASLIKIRGDNRVITSHKANELKSFEIVEKLHNLPPGHYKEVIMGLHSNDNGTTFKGYREIYFRITNDGVHTNWKEQLAHNIPTVRPPAKPSKTCSPDKSHNREMRAPGSIESQVKLLGRWWNIARYTNKKPVNHARIEVWYLDCTTEWKLVAISHTDSLGRFTAMYRKIDDAIQWKVNIFLESNVARVENKDQLEYGSHILENDLSAGGDLGDIEIPSGTVIQEAAWLFDDIMRFREFHAAKEYALPSEKAVIIFNPSEESRTGFYTRDNKIQVERRFVNSPNTALHELAHFYMYHHYGKWKAPGNCDDGQHIYYGATDTGCGWQEGWAHFVSAVVNGSSVFIYDDDLSFDMEHTQTYQPHGDKVEGRVAGALWDLYDVKNDGLDTRNYPYSIIYNITFKRKIIDFSWYWVFWKFEKQTSAAKYSIHQNGIMYDEDVFLEVGKPRIIDNKPFEKFAIRGNGALNTIETKMHKSLSKATIELYLDADLNDMIASSHHTSSNPYPKISDYYFDENKLYYVSIRNVNYDDPVSAELHLIKHERKLRDTTQPYANRELSPNTEALIDGEVEQWFKIKGNGEYATFETSMHHTETDTYIELYADRQQTAPVAVNDDGSTSGFSIIDRYYLEPEKTYYVKVRNYHNGIPVYAKVMYKSSQIGNDLPLFSDKQPVVLNGDVEKLFVIRGTGKKVDINTLLFFGKSRPILELYYDIHMNQPVPFFNWDSIDRHSRYKGVYLDEGKTYYLRVQNEVKGLPITCSIAID